MKQALFCRLTRWNLYYTETIIQSPVCSCQAIVSMEVVMELHMRSHRLESRRPDWTAAAVSGFAAGAVLMVLELLWSTLVADAGPWTVSHMIAAITMGPDALQSTGFSVPIV